MNFKAFDHSDIEIIDRIAWKTIKNSTLGNNENYSDSSDIIILKQLE